MACEREVRGGTSKLLEEFIDGLASPGVNTGCFAPVHGM